MIILLQISQSISLGHQLIKLSFLNIQAGDFLQAMYETVCLNSPHIARMSAESAEICKLAVNCFVTTKISFANMIGDIADSTPGADKYDILGAVGADSRVGGKCLKPGFGFGGPCFPRYIAFENDNSIDILSPFQFHLCPV